MISGNGGGGSGVIFSFSASIFFRKHWALKYQKFGIRIVALWLPVTTTFRNSIIPLFSRFSITYSHFNPRNSKYRYTLFFKT